MAHRIRTSFENDPVVRSRHQEHGQPLVRRRRGQCPAHHAEEIRPSSMPARRARDPLLGAVDDRPRAVTHGARARPAPIHAGRVVRTASRFAVGERGERGAGRPQGWRRKARALCRGPGEKQRGESEQVGERLQRDADVDLVELLRDDRHVRHPRPAPTEPGGNQTPEEPRRDRSLVHGPGGHEARLRGGQIADCRRHRRQDAPGKFAGLGPEANLFRCQREIDRHRAPILDHVCRKAPAMALGRSRRRTRGAGTARAPRTVTIDEGSARSRTDPGDVADARQCAPA
jgi:hypothetical protein